MSSNFMYAMLKALNNSQIQGQFGEILDAKATVTLANLEAEAMSQWDDALGDVSGDIASIAAGISGDDPTGQADLQAAESYYQTLSTKSQAAQNVYDSNTQASQQATGQDGTNMQNQAQLVTTLSSISATLASLLGHAYT